MTADDLYNALKGEAWKLAARSTLDIDDIRQELYLLCMEVSEGRSSYTPLLGGVHEYIMGWLWKYILRWPRTQSLDELASDDGDKILPDELYALAIDDELMRQEGMHEQHARDVEEMHEMRKRMKNQTTLAILVQTGHWSLREAAQFCGVSHVTISKLVRNA